MYFNDHNEKIVYVGSRDGDESLNCRLAGVTYPNPDYRMVRCPSREYVFEYVVRGRGYLESHGEVTEVSAGDFYMFRKGAELTYWADAADPYEKIWLNADGALLSRMCDLFRIAEMLVARVNVRDLFLEIHDRLSHGTEEELPAVHAEILCILFRILTMATKDTYFPSPARQNSLAERVKAYLDANLYADLSLDRVSEVFGVTKMHIIRVFKKEYGTTPVQYLIERKIGITKSLLAGTVMPIREIAALLRYANTQHFSSSFKAAVGMTPGAYRKTNIGK